MASLNLPPPKLEKKKSCLQRALREMQEVVPEEANAQNNDPYGGATCHHGISSSFLMQTLNDKIKS